jgi:hypothetical protein
MWSEAVGSGTTAQVRLARPVAEQPNGGGGSQARRG